MLRYYYDTEFIDDGKTIDLISIGIVAEDGREFYAVNADMDTGKLHRNPWLTKNVWPHLPLRKHPEGHKCRCIFGHLDTDHPDVRPKKQIARAVERFLSSVSELWAYYGAYDHVALAQLWGPMVELPDGLPMFTHDIMQEASRLDALEGLPKQPDGEHNALADARHVKTMWEWLATK